MVFVQCWYEAEDQENLDRDELGAVQIPFSILTHQLPKFHVSLLLFFYIYSAFIS